MQFAGRLLASLMTLCLILVTFGATPAAAQDTVDVERDAQQTYQRAHTPMVVPVVVWAVGLTIVRVGATSAVKRQVVVSASTRAAAKTAAKRKMTNAGASVRRVTDSGRTAMKSHSQRNLRHNLGVRTSGGTKVNYQAHHRLPVKYRDKFEARGINIDNPKFALWWCGRSHLQHARAYNKAWGQYFGRVRAGERTGTKADIFQEMDRITRNFSQYYGCPRGTRAPV